MFNLTLEQYAELRRQILEEAAKLCEDFAISDDDLDVMAGRIRALAAKTGANHG